MKSISELVIGKQWHIVNQGALHQSFNKSCPARGRGAGSRVEDKKSWIDWVSKTGSYEMYTKAVNHLNKESSRIRKNHYRIP